MHDTLAFLIHSVWSTAKRIQWLVAEVLRWVFSRDFGIAVIEGQTKEGEPVCIAWVGRAELKADIEQALFNSRYVTKVLPNLSATDVRFENHRMAARRLLLMAKSQADITICEVPPWAITPTKGSAFFQTLTEAHVDLHMGYSAWFASRKKSLRRLITKSVEAGDYVRWTDDPSLVEMFHAEVLAPFNISRHGAQAHVPNLDVLRQALNHENLLLLYDKDHNVLGGAFVIKSRIFGWRGLAAAIHKNVDPAQFGIINARLRSETLKCASENGQRRVSVGLSPSAYNHGISENKRSFDALPSKQILNYPLCEIKAESAAGLTLLNEARPYLMRDSQAEPWIARKNQVDDAGKNHDVGNAIAQSAKHMGTATVITMALGLILRLAMPRIYGPTQMGMFYYAESIATIFLSFLPLGLSSVIVREVPSSPGRARSILSQLVPAQFLFGCLLLTGMILFLFATGADRTTFYCAIGVGVFGACYSFHKAIIGRVYLALNQSVFVAKTEIAARVLLVLLAGAAMLAGAQIFVIAACFAVAQGAVILAMLQRARRDHLVGDRFSWSILQPMIKSSLPFFAVAVIIEIYSSIDTTMLRWLTTSEEVAYYGAANKLKGAGLAILPILQAALQPELSKAWVADRTLFSRLVDSSMRTLSAISFALAAGLLILPDVISRLVFGSAFDPAINAIAWLAPVLILTYLNVLMGSCLGIIGSGIPFLLVTALSLIINIVLNIGLITALAPIMGPGGGAAGAALATLISELFVLLMMKQIFKQGLSYKVMLYRIFVTIAPCLFIAGFLDLVLQVPLWERALILLLGLPTYLYVSQLVTRDDWMRLRYHVTRRDRRLDAQ